MVLMISGSLIIVPNSPISVATMNSVPLLLVWEHCSKARSGGIHRRLLRCVLRLYPADALLSADLHFSTGVLTWNDTIGVLVASDD